MTRTRLAPVITVAVFALLPLVACGVPGSGPAVVVSSAPPVGYEDGPQNGRQGQPPPNPSAAASPQDLVRLFLTAAAADPNRVNDNVTQFFTPGSRASWHPSGTGATIVRVTGYRGGEQSAQKAQVEVTGTVLGVLSDDGSVAPPVNGTGFDQTFQVVRVDSEWLIDNPPSDILLSSNGMQTYYDPWLVYFASPDHTSLVPDLRYLPRTVPVDKRRTMVVDWLLAGPSRWLSPAAVNEIPSGTRRRGNVVVDGNVVVVNLTSEASAARHPDLMAAQLTWTLRPMLTKLQIRVEDRPLRITGLSGDTEDRDTWKQFNPAAVQPNPQGFYLADGQVRPSVSGVQLPRVLTDPAGAALNAGVWAAALSADSTAAALVRAGADGRPALWVGRVGQQSRGQAQFTEVAGLAGASSLGRPSFLPDNNAVVLTVDGRLSTVDINGTVTPVDLSGSGALPPVSSVAVASDGARIALVAGGNVYVAPLARQRDSGQYALGRVRQLAVGFGNVTDIGWSREDRVVFGARGSVGEDGPAVGGLRGGPWEFSIDNVSTDFLAGTHDDAIPSQLAAAPGDPAGGRAHGPILLVIDGEVLQLYASQASAPGGGGGVPPRGSGPFFPE